MFVLSFIIKSIFSCLIKLSVIAMVYMRNKAVFIISLLHGISISLDIALKLNKKTASFQKLCRNSKMFPVKIYGEVLINYDNHSISLFDYQYFSARTLSNIYLNVYRNRIETLPKKPHMYSQFMYNFHLFHKNIQTHQ